MANMKNALNLVAVFLSYFIVFYEAKENGKPVRITEDNWSDILEGEWMIEFYAPWCPACRNFQSTWDSLAKWKDDFDVTIAQTDVTENPGLSGRFFVTALPTIYHVKDGVFRQYSGSRQENDLVSFIDEKKYLQLDPVSWWLDPKSIQMSAVGLFFKAAMVIRSFYTMMTTEYGIPEWYCYIIFAIITIVVGLFLGLLIVCCCDVFFPPKRVQLIRPNIDDKMDESDLLDDTPDDKPDEKMDEDNRDGDNDKSQTRKRQIRKADD